MSSVLSDPAALAGHREQLIEERDPRRRVVAVCAGTGCRAQGALDVVDALRAEVAARGAHDQLAIRATGCLGFCQSSPLLVQQPEGTIYRHAGVSDVADIVDAALNGAVVEQLLHTDAESERACRTEHEIPFYRAQQRLLLGASGLLDPTSIDDSIALGGYSAFVKALELGPEAVLEQVKRSGLRGRGGAGFPTGRKWEACRRADGDLKYVVCNADEGDPGAFMDDALLEGDPHSVIEGMLIGAYAIGARDGYVYVRQEYPVAVDRITRAIEQARGLGLLGEHVLGSDFSFDFRVIRGGGAFVCGEESADDGLARGPPRRAAPAAALPGGSRPVGSTHQRQQRRDVGQRPAHRPERGRLVPRHRHREVHGHQGLLAGRQGDQHRPRRGADGHHAARDRLRHRRRHPGGQGVQGGADRRPVRRLPARRQARPPGGLRHARRRGLHDGLRRHDRDGRGHLHGRRRQVLPALPRLRVVRQLHLVSRGASPPSRAACGHHGRSRLPPTRSSSPRR